HHAGGFSDANCEDSGYASLTLRCFLHNGVYDPCWVVVGRAVHTYKLRCMRAPWSRTVDTFEVGLGTVGGGPRILGPRGELWGVTLTSGERCLLANGARDDYHGVPINFYCEHSNVALIGDVDHGHAAWTMRAVRDSGGYHYHPAGIKTIRTGWYPRGYYDQP